MKTENIREVMGKKIRALRELHGQSQMDLAYKLGYESTGMISQVENGLKGMDPEKLRQVADMYKVSVDFLMDGQEFSKDDIAVMSKVTEILKTPEGERPEHFGAIKTLLGL